MLARLAGRSAQDVMTYMTIPSTISGGPSIFQVRIGSGEVLTAGDEADLLVAFYQHSYKEHLYALARAGWCFTIRTSCSPSRATNATICRRADHRADRRGDRRHGEGQG